MDNNLLFLRLHKQEYIKLLDSCDDKIRLKILSNPTCAEAQILETQVETRVKGLLGAQFATIEEAFSEAAG
jgi:hypothetical protein